jgi:FtsZ-interacting cell division protein ZipA
VAGAKKYKYSTKYNTNTYNTKYTPPSGVFAFPASSSKSQVNAAQCAINLTQKKRKPKTEKLVMMHTSAHVMLMCGPFHSRIYVH